ncbi:RIP metalloprotease RseP [Candidatus Peregrinibacteria bacterium RIFOXYC2_FULL_33_13]|nr:MAG: RIP metalloprotease RseP [Candidatus Peregrinibacteria bacterium RIFOXYC2_FULL_33_13]
MQLFLSIVSFIIIFSIVVLIHEAGHFIMARRAGIKVHEFGIGLPPRIWGFKKKGVLWSINAIPFGGFVRMLGEDVSEEKALTSKDSFINKTLGQRIKVVVAGVFMNILLAFVLLTVGFIVGMEPLIVTEDDFLSQIQKNNVSFETGMVVKDFKKDSIAEKNGLQKEDRIIDLKINLENNNNVFLTPELIVADDMIFSGTVYMKIMRDSQVIEKNIQLKDQNLGMKIPNFYTLPTIRVSEVRENSLSSKTSLKEGAKILAINGKKIFYVQNLFEELANADGQVEYEVFRDNEIIKLKADTGEFQPKVVFSEIYLNSPAEKAGLQKGDLVVKVNESNLDNPINFPKFIQENKGKKVDLEILRNNELSNVSVDVPESGLIGVGIFSNISYKDIDVSAYQDYLNISVLDIANVKYPFYQAPWKVFGEVKRLSVLTAKMFVDVIKKIVDEGKVPEGVSGPVGIARMTYDFVEKGFAALVRFTALISLSLGVINILPLPALDGGRLAFLIAEGVIGRRLNQIWESRIHAIGFILLMLLIFYVTFNDVMEIFS